MMAKMANRKTMKMQTLNTPGMDAIKVCMSTRMLFNWCIERNGRRMRAVLKAFRLL